MQDAQWMSRLDLNMATESEETTDMGRAFQSLIVLTPNEKRRILDSALGFFNFQGCPLVTEDVGGAKKTSGDTSAPPLKSW